MPASKSEKKHAKKDNGIAENVISLVRESVLAGIGMAFLGEEKIEKWARKIAKENKLSPKDIGNFIRDVKNQSNKARQDIEKRLKEMMKEKSVSNKEKSGVSSKNPHLKKKKKYSGSSTNSHLKKKEKTSGNNREIQLKEKEESLSDSNLQKWSVSFIPNKEYSNPES